MSLEIRIRCFLENMGLEGGLPAPRDLRSSLAGLLDQLEHDSADYVVKVLVHRKLGEATDARLGS